MGHSFRNGRLPRLLLAIAAISLTGCPPQTKPGGTTSPPMAVGPQTVTADKPDSTAVAPPQASEPPSKPTMPEVVMTEAQVATCLKRVGDALPEANLKTLDGQDQSLASALGKNLSVVLFWSSDDADFATFLLEDMTSDIVKPYSERGVQLVAINVRGEEGSTRKVLDRANAEFPTLRDPDGSLFSQMATEKLPRIYLVDAQGKILWFDIEYSRTTRRHLDQAIQVVLGGELASAPPKDSAAANE
jgi:peroxiredoxin